MRNLKRALSLVMAMALIVGMMVISASAVSVKDFTDSDEIDHNEAVNTMVALNVIDGKEDGSYFDPTGTLTRAEMAKLVTYILNGGVEPVLGEKVTPTYSDIDGHWAEAYIEYCSSMGIIAGDGAGKFNPTGTLTAEQTAKMFLTAMGYNAEVFGLVGNDWAMNVGRYANEAGLYKGLEDLRVSEPISRDDACQMAYNAIQAAVMIRGWSQDVTTGNITERYDLAIDANGVPYRTLFSERFGGKIFVGTFEGNYDTGNSPKGEIEIYGRLDTESSGNRRADFPFDLDISYIGEQYKVLFKDGKGGVDDRPDKNDTIYGVYNTGALTVYNITKGDLQDAGADVADGKIKFGDELHQLADTVKVYTNYKTGSGSYDIGSDTYIATNIINDDDTRGTKGLRKTSSDTIKLVCDSDGEIANVYVVETEVAEVTAVTSANIQLIGKGAKKVADCVNAEDLAVGDIVRYAELYSTSAPTTVFYGDVEVVEGVIEAYNATGDAVRINGTWYSHNDDNSFYMSTPTYTVGALSSSDVGNTVALYLDGGNNYGAYKQITGYNDYALIVDKDTVVGTDYLKAMLPDGSTKTYTHTDGAANDAPWGAFSSIDGTYTNAMLRAYELRSEGTKMAVNNTAAISGTTGRYVADNMTLVDGTTPYLVSADAVVYLYSTGAAEWRAYTAAELSSIATINNLQYIVKSGKVAAMAGSVASFPTANTDNYAFGYVTGLIITEVNDSPVTELTIWNGSESVALMLDGNVSGSYAKGDFVYYPIVADSVVVDPSDVDMANGSGVMGSDFTYAVVKVKSYDTVNGLLITTTDYVDPATKTVVSGADTSYKLTADTVIVGVKSADKAGSTVNTPVIYTQVVGKDKENALIVVKLSDDGSYYEVKAIFVDEDNYMQEYR